MDLHQKIFGHVTGYVNCNYSTKTKANNELNTKAKQDNLIPVDSNNSKSTEKKAKIKSLVNNL